MSDLRRPTLPHGTSHKPPTGRVQWPKTALRRQRPVPHEAWVFRPYCEVCQTGMLPLGRIA